MDVHLYSFPKAIWLQHTSISHKQQKHNTKNKSISFLKSSYFKFKNFTAEGINECLNRFVLLIGVL